MAKTNGNSDAGLAAHKKSRAQRLCFWFIRENFLRRLLSGSHAWLPSRVGLQHLLYAVVIALGRELRQVFAVNQQPDFGGVEHFALQQGLGDTLQDFAITRQDVSGSFVTLVHKAANLLVNLD